MKNSWGSFLLPFYRINSRYHWLLYQSSYWSQNNLRKHLAILNLTIMVAIWFLALSSNPLQAQLLQIYHYDKLLDELEQIFPLFEEYLIEESSKQVILILSPQQGPDSVFRTFAIA